MVVASPLESSASLVEVLSARAKRTPTSRLIIDAFGGAAVGAAAFWARPFGWFALIGAGAALFAYGVWALAERRLESDDRLSEHSAFALEMLQRAAAPVGIAGFLALLLGGLAIAFGPIIS